MRYESFRYILMYDRLLTSNGVLKTVGVSHSTYDSVKMANHFLKQIEEKAPASDTNFRIYDKVKGDTIL